MRIGIAAGKVRWSEKVTKVHSCEIEILRQSNAGTING